MTDTVSHLKSDEDYIRSVIECFARDEDPPRSLLQIAERMRGMDLSAAALSAKRVPDRVSVELKKAIEEQWRGRYTNQGYKYDGAKYKDAEANFFAGVMCALHAVGVEHWAPPFWVVSIMSGRPIVSKDGPVADPEKTMVSIPGNNNVPPGPGDKESFT